MDAQHKIVDLLSDKLNSYPRNGMGLVDDIVKKSDEFRETKTKYNKEVMISQSIKFRKVQ